MENMWQEFQNFVHKAFGLQLSEEQINQFKIYVEELKLWNEKFNLVSYKTEKELVFRHFADSLSAIKSLAKLNKSDFSLVDLGAGAGFPGILAEVTPGRGARRQYR